MSHHNVQRKNVQRKIIESNRDQGDDYFWLSPASYLSPRNFFERSFVPSEFEDTQDTLTIIGERIFSTPPNIRADFLTQAEKVAKRMAKTKIRGQRKINHVLKKFIIKTLHDVNYNIVIKHHRAGKKTKESFIFVLKNVGDEKILPRHTRSIKTQMRGIRISFPVDALDKPYIPHEDGNIYIDCYQPRPEDKGHKELRRATDLGIKNLHDKCRVKMLKISADIEENKAAIEEAIGIRAIPQRERGAYLAAHTRSMCGKRRDKRVSLIF